jgi:beta-glucosidase
MGIRSRVEELISRMDLDEKVAQLGSIPIQELIEDGRFSESKAERLIGKGIGQITRIAGAGMFDPKRAAAMANEIQRFLKERTRLGIPAIVHEECLSGFMADRATTFPQAIGMASTWDPELISQITSTIRRQMRATGAHQGLAPVLDVVRDPRWGRVEETFGEDPYLVAAMGIHYIKGLQGNGELIATAKHFAGHGFPEGGRNCAPVHLPERELREVFLLPFEAAVVKAGVGSIMSAYHEIDGIPCTASGKLLTRILREEWGFKGFVVSDYGAVDMLVHTHRTAGGKMDAAKQALEAGVDVELPDFNCFRELVVAVREGVVSESTVDMAVERVLRAKFELGLFENPWVDPEKALEAFDTEEDRRLALRAARESLVLLKNDGILPLRGMRSLAVIGPNANSTRNLLGDYSYTAHLSKPDAVRIVSVLEGIKSRKPDGVEVFYAKGCEISDRSTDGFQEALEVARKSDLIVAVVGDRSGLSREDTSGEGRDRSDLSLPGVQGELIKALCELGKPIVLVLVNGRPIALGDLVDKASAIVEAWLPGEEGGTAIADLLFGYYNPGGKLPISFPKSVGQIPVNYNRKPSSYRTYISEDSNPLFPFGHGLSYTEFEYSGLEISPNKLGTAGNFSVKFAIRNIGTLGGDEVVQLYIRDVVASVSRPVKELKGFKRIHLEPGERKEISFSISTELLAFYDEHMNLVVEPGTFEITIGSSSEDIRLKGEVELIGERWIVPKRSVFTSLPQVLDPMPL